MKKYQKGMTTCCESKYFRLNKQKIRISKPLGGEGEGFGVYVRVTDTEHKRQCLIIHKIAFHSKLSVTREDTKKEYASLCVH